MNEERESIRKSTGIHRKIGCGVIIVVFVVLVLPLFGRSVWLLELGYHLGLGWLLHFKECLVRLGQDPAKIVGFAAPPVLAAMGALIGFHRLAQWWMRERGVPEAWCFSQSATVGLLVLLGSGAAIALSGVLHELAWLPQGEITRSNRRTNLTLAINNARQLGIGMFEYETEYGERPKVWKDIEKIEWGGYGNWSRLIYLRFNSFSPPEPFVLLPSDTTLGDDPNSALMISPWILDSGKFVVLKADMSVTSLPASRLAEVLRTGNVSNRIEE